MGFELPVAFIKAFTFVWASSFSRSAFFISRRSRRVAARASFSPCWRAYSLKTRANASAVRAASAPLSART